MKKYDYKTLSHVFLPLKPADKFQTMEIKSKNRVAVTEVVHKMAQSDLERHRKRLFCVCEYQFARGIIFVSLVDHGATAFDVLLFRWPVKNGQLSTSHQNIQKAGFRVVPNHLVPSIEIHKSTLGSFLPQNSQSHCDNKYSQNMPSYGIFKPDIVFFNEQSSEGYYATLLNDKLVTDLVIVMGTSLNVQPVASIPAQVRKHVPVILINREVAQTSLKGTKPAFWLLRPHLSPAPFFEAPQEHRGRRIFAQVNKQVSVPFKSRLCQVVGWPNEFDVNLLGNCDDICETLLSCLGWKTLAPKYLDKVITSGSKSEMVNKNTSMGKMGSQSNKYHDVHEIEVVASWVLLVSCFFASFNDMLSAPEHRKAKTGGPQIHRAKFLFISQRISSARSKGERCWERRESE